MGDLPLMTETGTFVINGAERVIVSQLVRSRVSTMESLTIKWVKAVFLYCHPLTVVRG